MKIKEFIGGSPEMLLCGSFSIEQARTSAYAVRHLMTEVANKEFATYFIVRHY
jgi:hypothetical protein